MPIKVHIADSALIGDGTIKKFVSIKDTEKSDELNIMANLKATVCGQI